MKCKGGPSAELTSYSEEYPGHRGKNQYVPMNPEQSRGGLPFNANSTYSKEFSNHKGRSADKARPADQFNMTGSWLGDSSYRNQYQNPRNHVSKEKGSSLSHSQCLSRTDESRVSYKNPSSHFSSSILMQRRLMEVGSWGRLNLYVQQSIESQRWRSSSGIRRALSRKTLILRAWIAAIAP